MAKDTQSRKWQLTINNPKEYGLIHEKLKEILNGFISSTYWCMCDEIGQEGTYHTHIYIVFSSAVRFSTIKNYFKEAHIEPATGTSKQNYEYIKKIGKWLDTEKKETNIPETFEEYGDLPVESQGKRNDISNLYTVIKDGKTDFEILEQNPEYMLQLDKISKTRQIIKENEYRDKWRDLYVSYVFGKSGEGKTRTIMEKYGYTNVYRVTDYTHPFDGYFGQDIIIFEEFRSSMKIADMLNYLDGYPLELPCRFYNKIACYTKVYICTNIPLEQQYFDVQRQVPNTWQAFLRRIKHVTEYEIFGPVEYDTINEYLNRNKDLEKRQIKSEYI